MAGESFSVDICIIGSGAAGISMALDLKRNSRKRILVLEGSIFSKRQACAPSSLELLRKVETTRTQKSCHRFEDPNAQKLYDGIVSPEVTKLDETFLQRSRIRVLGGTTNCWGGWTRTLQTIDFQRGGWPITREELREAYEYALYLCSLSADPARPEFPLSAYDDPGWWKDKMEQEVEAIHFSPSDPCRGGVLTVMDRGTGTTDDNGLDFQLLWGPEIWPLGSDTLKRNANVRRLEFSGDRVQRAFCTSVDDNGKPIEDFTVTADVFVLAAGGIEVPRLMLLSGIPDPYKRIGKGFNVHPLDAWDWPGGMTFTSTGKTPEAVRTFHNGDVEFKRGSYSTKARAVLVPSDASLADPKLGNFRAMMNFPAAAKQQGSVNFNWEQFPSDANTLSLASAKDDLGDPKIALQWHLSEDDKGTAHKAVTLVGETLKNLGYASAYQDTHNFDTILMGDHHMSATRMGTDPKTSVVDKNCKVHGMQNLFVSSSSVFSAGGWSNPTLTIVALAVRLAKLLR